VIVSSLAAAASGVEAPAGVDWLTAAAAVSTALVGDTDRRCRAGCAHAHALLALKLLALGLERGRDQQLGAVELGNVAVSARRHRRTQRAHQVEGAVVLAGRTPDDFLNRSVPGGR